MKKILIVVISVCAAIAGLTAIFLTLPNTPFQKYAKELIIFEAVENSDEKFYSNLRTHPTTEYNDYKISIYNTLGKSFENSVLTNSTNIQIKNFQRNNTSLDLTFNIISGTTFSFTLESDNFETITKNYSATEYTQPDDIALKVSADGINYSDYMAAENNILYFVDAEHLSAAHNDGYPTSLQLLPYDIHNPSSNFNVSVSPSGAFSCFENILTCTKGGNSYVTISATDGSGAEKNFMFYAKYVNPTSIQGLPETITIDLSTNTTFTLPAYSVLPEYAKGYTISFEPTKDIIKIDNKKVSGLEIGECSLLVKADGVKLKEIMVSVIKSLPDYTINYGINDYTLQLFNNAISISGNAITLDLSENNSSYVTITIDISVTNYFGKLENINISIKNNSDFILFEEAGPLSLDYADKTKVYCNIFLLNKIGSITLNFSVNINNNLIENDLIINLVKN